MAAVGLGTALVTVLRDVWRWWREAARKLWQRVMLGGFVVLTVLALLVQIWPYLRPYWQTLTDGYVWASQSVTALLAYRPDLGGVSPVVIAIVLLATLHTVKEVVRVVHQTLRSQPHGLSCAKPSHCSGLLPVSPDFGTYPFGTRRHALCCVRSSLRILANSARRRVQKIYSFQMPRWLLRIQRYALWIEERARHFPTVNGRSVQGHAWRRCIHLPG